MHKRGWGVGGTVGGHGRGRTGALGSKLRANRSRQWVSARSVGGDGGKVRSGASVPSGAGRAHKRGWCAGSTFGRHGKDGGGPLGSKLQANRSRQWVSARSVGGDGVSSSGASVPSGAGRAHKRG